MKSVVASSEEVWDRALAFLCILDLQVEFQLVLVQVLPLLLELLECKFMT